MRHAQRIHIYDALPRDKAMIAQKRMQDAYESLSVWRSQANSPFENKSEGEILAAVEALRNFRSDLETLRAILVGAVVPQGDDASNDPEAEPGGITCRTASEMTGNRQPARTCSLIT
jgi:hypothetical protein